MSSIRFFTNLPPSNELTPIRYASGGRAAEGARGNIFYNVHGKITYPAGTMGVVLDLRSRTQVNYVI